MKENPANRIYQRAIDEFNGTKDEENNIITWTINS